MIDSRWRRVAVAAGAVLALTLPLVPAAAAAKPTPANHTLPVGTRFYVPTPDPGSFAQIKSLLKAHDVKDAFRIGEMVTTSQAVWVTKGSAAEVKKSVHGTMEAAERQRAVPILVAYNIPYRDCAQYSSGGAANTADYEAWIDGFAKGIGAGKAVVILEPDSLGIIPYNTDLNGTAEWCKPMLDGQPAPEADAAHRYAQLNYAVDRLEQQPNTVVYLDGTHSAWLGAGDIADRLVKAGVQRAQGFYLNVSNFQFTANSVQYGTWVSDCITYATAISPGSFTGCPNQFWNGGPDGTMIASLLGAWQGVGLNNYGRWSDTATDPALNTSGINYRYAGMLGTTAATTKFVVDTSRNAVGPWNPPAHPAGDAQDWCNPPDRGLGLRPTAKTGTALVAAYLWIKTPGQSDGSCTRWDPAGGIDPVRGYADPAAGAWFPQLALELARNANPALPVPPFRTRK